MVLNDTPVAICVNLDTANGVNTKLRLLRELVGEVDGCKLVFLPDTLPQAIEIADGIESCGFRLCPLAWSSSNDCGNRGF